MFFDSASTAPGRTCPSPRCATITAGASSMVYNSGAGGSVETTARVIRIPERHHGLVASLPLITSQWVVEKPRIASLPHAGLKKGRAMNGRSRLSRLLLCACAATSLACSIANAQNLIPAKRTANA